MKISHEVPLNLLDQSRKFNDYDYCLAPFIDKYPQYKSYYLNASKDGRFCIMDNGLHEGIMMSQELLIDKINEIQPNIFITPDVWNDSNETYKNAKYWLNVLQPQLPEKTELMCVIQGTSWADAYIQYIDLLSLGFKHIAFNYSSKMYSKIFPHKNINVSRMMGRVLFINRLVEMRVLNDNVYHHLLGASDWSEFKYYKGYDFIKSVDTSSPIINGLLGIEYNYNTSFIKPTQLIEEFIHTEISDSQLSTINKNIEIFKNQL